jgi:hypothetical protein
MNRTFFGQQVPGYAISYPDGKPLVTITIPVGLLRLWDTGAVWCYAANSWDGLDGMLALAQRLNAEPLYVLGRPPDSPNPPSTESLVQFLTSLLNRANGRVKYWELWNEPAITSMYWNGSVSRLLEQSRLAYGLIKSRVPDSVILTPSFNDLDSYGYQFARDYLTQARGAWWQRMLRRVPKHADGVAYHSYHDHVADLKTLRTLTDLPVWLTETVNAPLAELAALGVKCVVHNAQIVDDLDASTTGKDWCGAYDALTK